MEYRSQKIAYWYFAAALPLFALQILLGLYQSLFGAKASWCFQKLLNEFFAFWCLDVNLPYGQSRLGVLKLRYNLYQMRFQKPEFIADARQVS